MQARSVRRGCDRPIADLPSLLLVALSKVFSSYWKNAISEITQLVVKSLVIMSILSFWVKAVDGLCWGAGEVRLGHPVLSRRAITLFPLADRSGRPPSRLFLPRVAR